MKIVRVKFDDPVTGKPYHDFEFSHPESIEEMDEHTFVNWCSLINAGYHEEELKIRAFVLFGRIDLVKLAVKVPGADPLELFSQTINLSIPLINQRIIKKDFFTGSQIKLFSGLIGPGDFMGNLSFLQFGLSDHYFLLYLKDNKEEDLNQFCGAIYYKGDSFDQKKADEVIKHFSNVPLAFKRAALHNYWGLRNWQKTIWPEAFSTENNSSTTSNTPQLTDWNGIAINIAESGVFGHKAIVDASPINDVLKFIHDRKVEAKSRKTKGDES